MSSRIHRLVLQSGATQLAAHDTLERRGKRSATQLAAHDTLECGGKRSATPLWAPQRPLNPEPEHASIPAKASSPLRSADALHTARQRAFRAPVGAPSRPPSRRFGAASPQG